MKSAALICKTSKGEYVSIAGDSLTPLIAKAREVRDSGKLGKDQIEQGLVICSWRHGPQMRFNVKRHQTMKALEKAQVKAEAEAKKKAEAEATDKPEKEAGTKISLTGTVSE